MDNFVGAGGVADTLACGKDGSCQHQQRCGGGKGCVDHFYVRIVDLGGYSLLVELSMIVEL